MRSQTVSTTMMRERERERKGAKNGVDLSAFMSVNGVDLSVSRRTVGRSLNNSQTHISLTGRLVCAFDLSRGREIPWLTDQSEGILAGHRGGLTRA
jgi:hypothetical protein